MISTRTPRYNEGGEKKGVRIIRTQPGHKNKAFKEEENSQESRKNKKKKEINITSLRKGEKNHRTVENGDESQLTIRGRQNFQKGKKGGAPARGSYLMTSPGNNS